MDTVFTCADAHIATAEHLQYHSFMLSVYEMMHKYDLMSPVGRAAASIFQSLDAVVALRLGRRNAADTGGGLLCFDEFQISDVMDARLMPRRAPSLRQRLQRRASARGMGPLDPPRRTRARTRLFPSTAPFRGSKSCKCATSIDSLPCFVRRSTACHFIGRAFDAARRPSSEVWSGVQPDPELLQGPLPSGCVS